MDSRRDVLTGMVAGVKNWNDIREAALLDPMLMHLVHAVDRGGVPREQALIAVLLHQSDLLRGYQAAHAERLALQPPAPIILCEDCPRKEFVLKAVGGGT